MANAQLQRRLGLTSAISITVGAVIGSGIFLKPLKVAQALPSEGWVYALWIALGLVCLFGAFAYSELGAMFPEAGGQYAFLREGWGRFTAFLYGWTFFWVINAGTMAALALAFAENLLPLFGIDVDQEKKDPGLLLAVASAMILLLAIVNHFGVGLGALIQNASTFAKLASLGAIVIGGVFAAGVETAVTVAPAASAQQQLTVAGLVTAFMAIFWAYEGWYQLPFNAAELKRPERDLPYGLVGGMAVLIGVYLLVNVIYLRAVPFAEMQAMSPDTPPTQIAALTVERVLSPSLSGYLTLLIAISIFGAANPNLLSSPRAFYAMAQDGLMPRALTKVHPKWGTPVASIWVQAACGVLIIVTLQGFHDVTDFVVFAAFLFYAMTVAAVYRLRIVKPNASRPYRCWGYPVTPFLFIAVSIAFVVAVLQDETNRKNALIGLSIIGAGVVAYALFLSRGSRGAGNGTRGNPEATR
jgi:APA family basic amino acid/polyamine antiporter